SNLSVWEAHPVCVVKGRRSLQSPCQFRWIIEMKWGNTYLITERIRTIGVSGERLNPLPY
ncbi:MAG: hypothetical protein HW406_1448, partial [Candidatus Brocadiaceae bacterium]|nr:hypothetical protein [Candidatus Brocadiaceae bacterium]